MFQHFTVYGLLHGRTQCLVPWGFFSGKFWYFFLFHHESLCFIMIVTGFSSCKNNKNNGENKKLKKRSSLKCSCSLPLGGLGWVSPSFGLPSLREGPGGGYSGVGTQTGQKWTRICDGDSIKKHYICNAVKSNQLATRRSLNHRRRSFSRLAAIEKQKNLRFSCFSLNNRYLCTCHRTLSVFDMHREVLLGFTVRESAKFNVTR